MLFPGKNFSPNRKHIAVFSLLITGIFYLVFVNFFPNRSGKLGDDFTLDFPVLLDGLFWYHNNGLFAVPWFTPSFGGGLPKFPNPQSIYYSIPQFLCFITDPLTSTKLTLFLFAFIGFAGFYLFLRKIFQFHSLTALLGASLFLFNGFFVHRMIIGHVGYHAYMMFPLLAYFIFNSSLKNIRTGIKKFIAGITGGALILAYMIYSGALHIIPPLMLTLVACAVVYDMLNSSFSYKRFIVKIFFIFLGAFFLSAAYLNATLSFLNLFPRDLYPLPGVPQIADLAMLCFRALFLDAPHELAMDIFVNRLWRIGPHEMEFGAGLVPLILIIIAIPFFIKKVFTGDTLQHITITRTAQLLLLVLLLAVPLALNYYTPAWNAFLKTVPYFKSSSSNLRWFSAYVPFIILLACIAFEKITWFNNYRLPITLLFIGYIVISNAVKDRTYYHNQDYNPKIILDAYDDLKAGKLRPEISYIDEAVMKGTDTVTRNDVMALGSSQLKPYEPIFGYRGENFPKKSLVAGKAMQVNADGFLNLKNPVGYVFPKENNIEPGDHFKAGEAEKADRFRRYLKFPFKFSAAQKFANALTLFSLTAFALCLAFFIVQNLYRGLVPVKKKVAAKPGAGKKKRK